MSYYLWSLIDRHWKSEKHFKSAYSGSVPRKFHQTSYTRFSEHQDFLTINKTFLEKHASKCALIAFPFDSYRKNNERPTGCGCFGYLFFQVSRKVYFKYEHVFHSSAD